MAKENKIIKNLTPAEQNVNRVNTSDAVVVGQDFEAMVADAVAAIDALPIPASAKDALRATARQSILSGEAERREREIAAHIQWLVANGFRKTKTAGTDSGTKCVCGVGRHTENSAKCETYLAGLRDELKDCTNEIRRDQLNRYIARETAKA